MASNIPNKILVVDDEPRMVQLIGMNLKLEGFEVISPTGGGGVGQAHGLLGATVLGGDVLPLYMHGITFRTPA